MYTMVKGQKGEDTQLQVAVLKRQLKLDKQECQEKEREAALETTKEGQEVARNHLASLNEALRQKEAQLAVLEAKQEEELKQKKAEKPPTTQEQIDEVKKLIQEDERDYQIHALQVNQFHINAAYFEELRRKESGKSQNKSNDGQNGGAELHTKGLASLEEVYKRNQAKLAARLAALEAKRQEELKQEALEKK